MGVGCERRPFLFLTHPARRGTSLAEGMGWIASTLVSSKCETPIDMGHRGRLFHPDLNKMNIAAPKEPSICG